MNVREALVEILSKGTSVDVVVDTMSDEDIQDLSIALELLQKAKFIDPKKQQENRKKATKQANMDAMEEAGLDIKESSTPKEKIKSHLTVIKAEMLKYNELGQWDIEKAAKPGPTLDYSKINAKPDYDKIESEASSIDYSDKKNIEVKKPWAGASAKRQKAMDSINAKQNRTAIEEIKARQETKKKYGL